MVTINPTDRGDGNTAAVSSSGNVAGVGRELVHEPAHEHLSHEPTLEAVTTGPVGYGVPWGSIIAGALTALSLLMLSSALATACRVPAYVGGNYGWGAGIWGVITSIIAFFVGGLLAAVVGGRFRLMGALSGLLTWVLGVPLALLLVGLGVGLMRNLVAADALRMAVQPVNNAPAWALQTGAAWGVFVGLLLGLLSAIAGGIIGSLVRPMLAGRSVER